MSKLHLHALRLCPFGNQADTQLEFGAPGKLTVVYGPNGAGKSTLRRAVHHLLFGIPRAQIKDDYRFQRAELRLEADLEIDGERRRLARIRGERNSLRDVDAGEAVLPAEWLSGLLGMEREAYESRFCLDHPVLRSGGEALISAPPGELASLGLKTLQTLRRLEQALSDEAEGLFKPSGQNPPLNAEIKHYRELSQALKHAGLSAKQWHEAESGLQSLQAQCKRQNEGRQALKQDGERLRRVKGARSALAQYREARAGLERHAEVADLGEDFERRRGELEQAGRKNTMLMEQARQRIAALIEARAALSLSPGLIEQAEAVEDCIERRGGYRHAVQQLPAAQLARAAADTRYQEACRKAGHPVEQALPVLAEAALERVRSLAGGHAALLGAVHEATEAQQHAAREHAKSEAQEQPGFDDTARAGLIHALEESAGLGAELETSGRAERALGDAEAALAAALQRLGEPYADGAGFPGKRVPTAAAIDHFLRAFDAQDRAEQDVAAQFEALEDERHRNARQRDELCEQGVPPSQEDLQQARERRELQWRHIKGRLTAVTADEHPTADAELLPGQYESLVVGADELADRRYDQADRVGRIERTQAELRALEDRQRRLEEKRDGVAAAREALTGEWQALWLAAGVTAVAAPAGMHAWRADYDAALTQFEACQGARQDLQRCRDRVERLRLVLIEGLAAGPDALDLPAATLRQHAQTRLRALETRSAAIREQQSRLALAAADLATADRGLAKAAQRMKAWQADWKKALAVLGLDAQLAVEPALAQLRALAACAEAAQARRQAADEVAELGLFEESYTREVGALAERLLSTPPVAVDARVGALKTALQQAQAAAAERLRVESELDQLGRQLRALEQQHAEQALQEQGLLGEAGVEALQDLPEIQRRAAQKRDCAARAQSLRAQLFDIGDGRTPEQLAEEAEQEPEAGLQERLEEIEAALEGLEYELGLSQQALGEAQKSLENLSEGQAEPLAQQKDGALARVRELAERYASRELAAAVVRKAIEFHAERHQDPLLARASECYAEITGGVFQGVRTDYGERDETVHLAIRAGGERVPVESLSDGERDALFLALYIAALEQHLAAGTALPVVFDDVLINVDDPRCEPILRLLGRLAEKTQVLLFTHHRRVAELASECADATVCSLETASAAGMSD